MTPIPPGCADRLACFNVTDVMNAAPTTRAVQHSQMNLSKSIIAPVSLIESVASTSAMMLFNF